MKNVTFFFFSIYIYLSKYLYLTTVLFLTTKASLFLPFFGYLENLFFLLRELILLKQDQTNCQ